MKKDDRAKWKAAFPTIESTQGAPALADHLIRVSKGRGTAAFFVTGTDTDIGKTFCTCVLLREFRDRGIDAIGFKPVSCGSQEDARKFQKLSIDGLTLGQLNPVYLKHPLAPVSQKSFPWKVLMGRIREAYRHLVALKPRFILVEGAGGLLCPVTHQHTVRDIAKTLALPLIIVAPNRLGVLNQTLMTLESATYAKLHSTAIVLNRMGKRGDVSSKINFGVLKKLTRIPLYEI